MSECVCQCLCKSCIYMLFPSPAAPYILHLLCLAIVYMLSITHSLSHTFPYLHTQDANTTTGVAAKHELLPRALTPLSHMMKCVEMGWMCILCGPAASGKTSLVRLLARMVGHPLYEFAMNSAVDTTDILGVLCVHVGVCK